MKFTLGENSLYLHSSFLFSMKLNKMMFCFQKRLKLMGTVFAFNHDFLLPINLIVLGLIQIILGLIRYISVSRTMDSLKH